jgi:hypothetical protein
MPATSKRPQATVGRNFFIVRSPYRAGLLPADPDLLRHDLQAASCYGDFQMLLAKWLPAEELFYFFIA